jgi:hypothetical protein
VLVKAGGRKFQISEVKKLLSGASKPHSDGCSIASAQVGARRSRITTNPPVDGAGWLECCKVANVLGEPRAAQFVRPR